MAGSTTCRIGRVSDRLAISPDVVFEVLEGEAILLHMQDGTYYRLNKTGTRVWELLESEPDRSRIVAAIADEFDAPADRIATDVDALLTDLTSHGLILSDQP